MKPFTSFQELDALGEGLSKDYIARTHRWNARCFDIEGFITDYLGLAIVYESFAEKDSSKIGFLSNGIDPLLVYRNGTATPIVFPKDTIVVERYLLNPEESSRKRFTLAHEAAHKVMERHVPMQNACFHSEYDAEANYCRLSRDDGTDKESNSIANQKKMLQSYARTHGLINTKVYADDGFTGTNFAGVR